MAIVTCLKGMAESRMCSEALVAKKHQAQVISVSASKEMTSEPLQLGAVRFSGSEWSVPVSQDF